ncbi:MAG: transferase [Planctomycetota bacterium]
MKPTSAYTETADGVAESATGDNAITTTAAASPLPIGDRNANPRGVGFWALVREDFAVHGREWMNQGFWALFWHRFGNWRMGVRFKLIRAPFTLVYRLMFKFCEMACGIKLSYNVPVGRRVRLEHFGGMILGARSIGNDVTLRQNTTLGVASKADLAAKPTIEDGCDIGAGVCILGNVRIGQGSKIGANAVVTKDIPPYSVAVGIPAKVIKTLPSGLDSPGSAAAAQPSGGEL